MPRHELIPLDARDDWEHHLEGLPHGFHHTWDHAYAMHLSSGDPTFLYSFREGATRVVCPLVERRFGDYVDIATPSGLGGFTGTNVSSSFARHWLDFTSERQYVSGYIALHPLFAPPPLTENAATRNTLYVLDLTAGCEALSKQMDRNRRRQLRGWEQRAAEFTTDRGAIADFLAAHYEPFMRGVNSRELLLTTNALRFLCGSERCLVVGAPSRHELEAVYLFGATPFGGECLVNVATSSGRSHATDLLWWGIRTLGPMGVPALNLGGGVTEDDAIARSKQRFRARRLPLKVLREVYREDVYAKLCRDAGVEASRTADYFPAYRAATRPLS